MTNKTPTATYRAPSCYEGTFVRERLLDAVAARVGVDPIEVRRRNLIKAAEMPFHRPVATLDHDIVDDCGDYAGLLDKAPARVGWEPLQAPAGELDIVDGVVRRGRGEGRRDGCRRRHCRGRRCGAGAARRCPAATDHPPAGQDVSPLALLAAAGLWRPRPAATQS
jgi:hypothetical protein